MVEFNSKNYIQIINKLPLKQTLLRSAKGKRCFASQRANVASQHKRQIIRQIAFCFFAFCKKVCPLPFALRSSVCLILTIQLVYSQIDYKLLNTYNEHTSGIECAVLSPDGKTLITVDEGGFLFYWDINTMKIIYRTRGHGSLINSVLFNKSGTKFVTCDESSKIKLWDFNTRKLIMSYTSPFNLIAFAVLSADEKYIYFGGYPTMNYSTRAYEQTGLYRVNVNGKTNPELLGASYFNSRPLEADAGITDGNIDESMKYIMITKGYHVYFWNIQKQSFDFDITTSYSLNNLTPTKDHIYVWGDGHMLKLDVKNNYRIANSIPAYLQQSTYSYSKMALSDDKQFVISGEDANNVNIWNTTDLKLKQVLKGGHTSHVRTFTFAKNDSIIISGGYDGTITVWGVPQEKKDTIIPIDTIPVITDVVFTENNIPVTIKERQVELQSTITVSEPEFDIEIWDRSVVDGDSISLNLNGNWILQEYMVVKAKLTIHVKVDPSALNNYLILYALNLGEISPNTAAVQVVVDGKEYKLTLSSDLKKSGALNFSYAPK